MKKVFVILASSLLLGCVDKSTHQKALQTIDSLRIANQTLIEENDELLNGEKRLIGYIELHNKNNDFLKSYDCIVKLRAKHPESDYIAKNEQRLVAIEKEARIILDSIEKVKRDSIRRANIRELGIWKLGDYTNDFDEPTGEKYIYTDILGRFSNIATSNSALRVNILIDQKGRYSDVADNTPEMTIRFDEYNNGVYEEFGIHIHRISALKIVNKAAKKVYTTSANVLLNEEEGVYEFYISYNDGTKYEFSVDTKYLNNAIIKAGMKSIFESQIENKQ